MRANVERCEKIQTTESVVAALHCQVGSYMSIEYQLWLFLQLLYKMSFFTSGFLLAVFIVTAEVPTCISVNEVGDCAAADVNAYINSLPNGAQCLEATSTVLVPTNLSELPGALQTFCTAQCGKVIATFLIQVCQDYNFAFVLNLYCLPTLGSSLLGEYCRFSFPDVMNASSLSVLQACETFDLGSPSCPAGCQDALNTVVANIGCCYQYLYHSTNEILNVLLPQSSFRTIEEELLDIVSSSELWTSCSIPLIDLCTGLSFPGESLIAIGSCTQADMSQFLLSQTSDCRGNSFNTSVLAEQNAFDANCKEECKMPIVEYINETCNDPVASLNYELSCLESDGSLGSRCHFSLVQNLSSFDAFRVTCLIFSASNPDCPSGCADALTSLSSQFGCCYQSIFNSTLIQHSFLVDGRIDIEQRFLLGVIGQQALWDSCGVPLIEKCAGDSYQEGRAVMVIPSEFFVLIPLSFAFGLLTI